MPDRWMDEHRYRQWMTLEHIYRLISQVHENIIGILQKREF